MTRGSAHAFAIITAFASIAGATAFSNVDVVFKGSGWLKSGKIVHSTDTLTGTGFNNYNGNYLQDAGVLFTGIANLNENFEAAFGLGAIQKHTAQGNLINARNVRLGMNIFSTQSRITWFPQGKNEYQHRIDLGLFPYKYDANIKNLGLYLIRGPVYPGLLISGFETREMLNTANMLGARWESRFGHYTQDLVITSETEMRPYFDFSAIYVGTLRLGRALELGGGFNLYHYLPVRSGATSPSLEQGYDPASQASNSVPHPFDHTYAVPTDTTIIPIGQRTSPEDSLRINYTWADHRGIKVMARFSLDMQAWLGYVDYLGRSDLKIYGEAAVLGIKDYPGLYDNVLERIPVMLGLYLPAFRVFDVLALEVQYYGSRIVPDMRKLVDEGSAIPQSPWVNRTAPPDSGVAGYHQRAYDVDGDNWKWSLYFSRVFAGHIRLSGQIANDHFRTGGTPGLSGASYEEALTSLSDWYWFLKLSYFF